MTILENIFSKLSNIGGSRKPIEIGTDNTATKAPCGCITAKYKSTKMVIPTRYMHYV